MSQADLASKAGIPPSSVSHFEAGSRKPSVESLRKIAATLEVTTDYLLGAGPTIHPLTDKEHERVAEVRAEAAATFEEQIASQPRYINKLVSDLTIDETLFTSGRIAEITSQVKDVAIGEGSYQQILAVEAKAQEGQNNHNAADTFHLLYVVCDFRLQPHDTKKPFHPKSFLENTRSPLPKDLNEQQTLQLGNLIDHIKDPILTARVADTIWVKLKKVAFARRAVEAYLTCSKDTRLWPTLRLYYFERALRLSIQLKDHDLASKAKSVFRELQEESDLYNKTPLTMLSLARDTRLLELNELASEASRLAMKLVQSDPHQTKDLNTMAAIAFQKLNDEKAAKSCYRHTAKTFQEIAETCDPLIASELLEDAIDALRLAGAPKAEIQTLNQILVARGKASLNQMKRLESERIDFRDTVRAAKKLIEGLSPIDALVKLAFQFPVLSYVEYKTQVEQSIKNRPLLYFVTARQISRDGRQYARRNSFLSENPKELQAAFDTEVAALMAIQVQLLVRFCLIPALDEIHWTSTDFARLSNVVSTRPIVPPGRHEIFYHGIKVGLEGDFTSAAHILIPQLEHSLRFHLEIRGHAVTTIDDNNLHNEISLNEIFRRYHKELEDIFGSTDFTFILKSFLCSDTGENFRNELSHGLVSSLHDYRLAFAWWLAVYLLFLLKFPESGDPRL